MRMPKLNERGAAAAVPATPVGMAGALAASGVPGVPAVPRFGPWKSAEVTDVGRPMGRQFSVGETVYYRETLGADPDAPIHLFLRGTRAAGGAAGGAAPGVRRWLTQTQLDGATDEHEADVGDALQGALNAEWQALEPPHAGFHPGTRIPLRYCGLDTRVLVTNPEVKGPGWQGDTVFAAPAARDRLPILAAEMDVWVAPPQMPPAEEFERMMQDLLAHEAVEYEQKERLVDGRWPHISAADRARCFDEMEGPAHLYTIGAVEGYYGPDAERRYLVECDYAIMRRLGFGKLVDDWERTDG